ncbi:ABC transporter permease subunit [Rhodobacteraceae bacterium 2CG4]|uniref:ABC transporter permease subunit n=1 Tax=Halovulum marinum TaxID=2662447 RepID=A0A6L5Z681_9RHOB|nr:ABC transporter permease subunit [Halovulum marinum]MSU91580.1 ABC transporter permease subunit [Halovulum marinum]
MKRTPWFLWLSAGAGFVFLWVPIVSLVVYSFNASKLVTVWAGFSTRWYGELLRDQQVIDAVWVSLRVALASASLAVALGTLAALVLVRFGRFWGKPILRGMAAAPLVMPEVLLGLSLLLLFVTMERVVGWPQGRGIVTIVIAHTTFCLAYVAVVVQSRLADMDDSLEEAARDLGAGPVRVFFDVTLPLIAPALIAGWLLAFTLSLDDLVVASFATGPGASTLPIVIFSKVRLGVSPDINALATIILVVVALGVALAGLAMRRRN